MAPAEALRYEFRRAGSRLGVRRVRVLFTERRFWVVQTLMVVATLFHGLPEALGAYGNARGFFHGIAFLAVQLYVLPIVLAAYWYGLEGAVMTGVAASLLSIPNLVLFHRTDFVWLGELVANTIVLGFGLIVGLVTERAQVARAEAETTSRRLRTLQGVSAVLNRYEAVRDLIQAVLDALTATEGVEAATFTVSESAIEDRYQNGGLVALPPATTIASGDITSWSSMSQASVEIGGQSIGRLVAYHSHRAAEAEQAEVLVHVARELALALEKVIERESNRVGLQNYARAVTVAQETERRRIARDLHDGPAQSLVVLARGLAHLGEAKTGDPGGDEARNLRGLAQDTLQAVRETIGALRPSLLDDLGLLPALQSLVGANSIDGLPIRLRSAGLVRRLSDHTEVAAYRIAQEALANAVAHSGCSRVDIDLEFGESEIGLTIADDGSGFDHRDIDTLGSFGIMGMRERADLVGGSLDITSELGVGTTVSFIAPV